MDTARWLVTTMVSASLGAACAGRPLPQAEVGDGGCPGGAPFVSVPPCLDEAGYATGSNTVVFGFLGSPSGFVYDPSCLAIAAGETVTFTGSFAAHPLYPSMKRGTIVPNPIGGVSTGDNRRFSFPQPGFFAYYCGIHGAADDGSAMAGVIWVR